MKYRNLLVSVVAFFAIIALAVSASAYNDFGSITSVKVNDVEATSSTLAVFAGETLPVRVTFNTNSMSGMRATEDVRIRVWIAGARETSQVTDRVDVLQNRVYSKLLSLEIPYDLDPSENLSLEVTVESKSNGMLRLSTPITLAGQRESYEVQVLDVAMDNQVKAGSNVPVDIVLKNRGRQFAEDTFVQVAIPALNVAKRAYFGDLSPVDQGGNVADKEDAAERRIYIEIPSNVPAGIYRVEVTAFNADSTTVVAKQVAITGASADTRVVSAAESRTFAVGEKGKYSVTLVNKGNSIQVYELSFKTTSGLTVEASDPVVAVPAGSSRTVNILASAKRAGEYDFSVSVDSDGQVVATEDFKANVEGGFGSSGAVLLTVILAVVFVVLLIVLIVLLTRKPKKSEEFGESYY